MSYTIVIILITAIIVAGIAATAVQQHNERKDQLKRDEISKHKNALEETEQAFLSGSNLPLSHRLQIILKKRSLKALKGIDEQTPMPELKQKIKETTETLNKMGQESPTPADPNSFTLPTNDKVIIKCIQVVKKLRMILRSEKNQGSIPQDVFAEEDKLLERLQLRINVETLNKRAVEAIKAQMQGSARQYVEKAVRALAGFKPQDDYTQKRSGELKTLLSSLENHVKDKNLEQIINSQNPESKELDDLFAPKKKW